MVRLIVIVLCGFIFSVSCEVNWVSEAKLVRGEEYFAELMQETFYEVERRGWSNLRLIDFTQTLNSQMYGWLVAGTVTYANGFLVSIQKITIDQIRSNIFTRTVNNETNTIATADGRINLYDAEVGYDVKADLRDIGGQHFTGSYVHTSIELPCLIEKNLSTKEIKATVSLDNLPGGTNKMIYLPASNVTEVISRSYQPSSNWDGIQLWGRNIIAPIMVDIATNKLEFPSVCFNNC